MMKRTRRDPWDVALSIINLLRARGYRALLAGGCVRDRLRGTSPQDYDVATNARPEELLRLFPKARGVGAAFGVILVRTGGQEIEVATFRSDGPYRDGRRPDSVEYGTEEQDARRRDFTINGLFLDPVEDRIIDYVGGRVDLEAGIIRTIGDPEQRFTEDHLRMLRAVRFAARLGFDIEPDTFRMIQGLGPRLKRISAERIWMELEAILTAPTRSAGWDWLVRTELWMHALPGWASGTGHEFARTVGLRIASLPPEPISGELALAAVLTNLGQDKVSETCRFLKLSNRSRDAVFWLTRSLAVVLARGPTLSQAELKRLLISPSWDDLTTLWRAELEASSSDLSGWSLTLERSKAVPPERIAPPPLLTGDRLVALGYPEGPKLGEVLDAVYIAQLNETVNRVEEAETMARRLFEG